MLLLLRLIRGFQPILTRLFICAKKLFINRLSTRVLCRIECRRCQRLCYALVETLLRHNLDGRERFGTGSTVCREIRQGQGEDWRERRCWL